MLVVSFFFQPIYALPLIGPAIYVIGSHCKLNQLNADWLIAAPKSGREKIARRKKRIGLLSGRQQANKTRN